MEDSGKENSKNGANTGGGGTGTTPAAETNAGPLPLDAEGLPPLRFDWQNMHKFVILKSIASFQVFPKNCFSVFLCFILSLLQENCSEPSIQEKVKQ